MLPLHTWNVTLRRQSKQNQKVYALCGLVGWSWGTPGGAFGVMLALLEHLLTSFYLSWDALGCPFGPRGACAAKVGKKVRYLEVWFRGLGTKIEPKIDKNRCKKTHRFRISFFNDI